MSATTISTDLTIPSDLGEARRVQTEIEEALQACAYNDTDIFSIKLALEEALVNAIKHGNQMDPDKKVSVSYQITSNRFDITITDQGPGFNPEEVPDPTLPENIEKGSGRGVYIIKELMTTAQYLGTGNVLSMSKVPERGE